MCRSYGGTAKPESPTRCCSLGAGVPARLIFPLWILRLLTCSTRGVSEDNSAHETCSRHFGEDGVRAASRALSSRTKHGISRSGLAHCGGHARLKLIHSHWDMTKCVLYRMPTCNHCRVDPKRNKQADNYCRTCARIQRDVYGSEHKSDVLDVGIPIIAIEV
jgi:hypothetical protein